MRLPPHWGEAYLAPTVNAVATRFSSAVAKKHPRAIRLEGIAFGLEDQRVSGRRSTFWNVRVSPLTVNSTVTRLFMPSPCETPRGAKL